MSRNDRASVSEVASKQRSQRPKMRPQIGGSAKKSVLFRLNALHARATWGVLSKYAIRILQQLSDRHSLDVAAGEVQLLDNRWYVTHAGLLQIARRNRCVGISTSIQKGYSDPGANRWVFKATVYKSPHSRGFVGYGDADPSNVSSLVHGAEMRVAETRAVNRALRKAYGIGLCSVEELGWAPRSNASGSSEFRKASANGNNGHQNSQPRLRDRLCLLIRQHHLDAGLVKAYAADYCGTPTLRDAKSRSKPSSTIWLSVPSKIARGWSASSTAIPNRRRSCHEASHPRFAW
jgi:hypothetical protein